MEATRIRGIVLKCGVWYSPTIVEPLYVKVTSTILI